MNCGKKDLPEQPAILTLKEMSDLSTVEYTITKIVKANDNKTWFKIGDKKILMSCEAIIKGGIDMSKINENSFIIKDKTIEVTLPEPKITSFNIPHEKIKTEYEEVGIFRTNFTSTERDLLTRQAEVQIRNSIPSLGILNQAKANTALFVTNFLRRLGYENIKVKFEAEPAFNPIQ
jgi:hypothetical protein